MAAPAPGPHPIAIGICALGTLLDQQRLEAHAPRILCDEGGQLYEWSGERLTPLPPHQLRRAIVSGSERGCRPLLPEPGVPLVVPWNEFHALLASQFAHPERLRDGHRVNVVAQIYEVTRPQSPADLAESITGDRARSSELTILTDRMLALFGLVQRVPPPMRHPHQPPGGDMLMPHERVVRLLLAADPTASAPGTEPRATANAAPHPDSAAPRSRADKESIPQAFLRPWEFRKSREDVLYELSRPRSVLSAIRSWLAAITSRAARRLEHRCWEMLRSGKSPEEQLWSVPPPRRRLDDREVRDWAALTLGHAGYNVQTMLLEWEIFWRRKLG